MTISPTAALLIAATMAIIAVSAILIAVVVRRPDKASPSAVMLEVIGLRERVKDLKAENEKLLQAGQEMEQADREKAEANVALWSLAEKLAGILGYTNFEASIDRLEQMPGMQDEPALFHYPVLDDSGELLGVKPTNCVKDAYVAWMHWPLKTFSDTVKPAIEKRYHDAAQRIKPSTSANVRDLAAAGMVSPEAAEGRGTPTGDQG